MKKLIAVIMCLGLICVGLTSCKEKPASKDATQLINTAFKKSEKLKSVDMASKITTHYTRDTATIESVSEYHLMESNIGNAKKYEMSIEGSTKTGSISSQSYEEYYKSGYFYTNRHMGKFKAKTPFSKLDNKGTVLTKISKKDMRTFEQQNNTTHKSKLFDDEKDRKNCTKILFECKSKSLREQIEASFAAGGQAPSSVEIKNGKGEYVIDSNGYLIYQKFTVSAAVTVDSDTLLSTVVTEVEYINPGSNKVNPYDPEDSEYTEINDLQAVAELNSKMASALSASEVNMSMNISTEVEQGGNKSGYVRDYVRKLSAKDKRFVQTADTEFSANGKTSNKENSSYYYTDGTYYTSSDRYGIKIKSDMDFSTFYSGVYVPMATSPADMYSPSVMNSISKKEKKGETVYEFTLNTTSDGGYMFMQSLFGPFENFGGNLETAQIKVKSFSGKSFVNKNGEYYKTEMSCEIEFKFEEGDVSVKAEQTVNLHDVSKAGDIDFPQFKGYKTRKASELIEAYSGSSSSGSGNNVTDVQI